MVRCHVSAVPILHALRQRALLRHDHIVCLQLTCRVCPFGRSKLMHCLTVVQAAHSSTGRSRAARSSLAMRTSSRTLVGTAVHHGSFASKGRGLWAQLLAAL